MSDSCDPIDYSLPGSSVHGVLQAKILEWVAMPSSRGIFPTQGSNPHVLYLLPWQMSSLLLGPSGKPPIVLGACLSRAWVGLQQWKRPPPNQGHSKSFREHPPASAGSVCRGQGGAGPVLWECPLLCPSSWDEPHPTFSTWACQGLRRHFPLGSRPFQGPGPQQAGNGVI